MEKLTKVHYKGKSFVVVSNEQGILCAIDTKYLDGQGRLTTCLNGLQMLVDQKENTLPAMINRIKHHVEIEIFVAENKLSFYNENDMRKLLEFSHTLPF